MNQTVADPLVSKPNLAKELSISSRTLSRWLEDSTIDFPRPIVLRNRNFFRRSEVESWKLRQAVAAARTAVCHVKKAN